MIHGYYITDKDRVCELTEEGYVFLLKLIGGSIKGNLYVFNEVTLDEINYLLKSWNFDKVTKIEADKILMMEELVK